MSTVANPGCRALHFLARRVSRQRRSRTSSARI